MIIFFKELLFPIVKKFGSQTNEEVTAYFDDISSPAIALIDKGAHGNEKDLCFPGTPGCW